MTTAPPNGRTLIVEDDEAIREMLQEFLAWEGYVTATARGADAIATAKTFQPDVILLNLTLADTTGAEVSVALRADPETQEVPIILMSAHPHADKIARYLPVEEFVSKPFNLDHLEEVLARWIAILSHPETDSPAETKKESPR